MHQQYDHGHVHAKKSNQQNLHIKPKAHFSTNHVQASPSMTNPKLFLFPKMD